MLTNRGGKHSQLISDLADTRMVHVGISHICLLYDMHSIAKNLGLLLFREKRDNFFLTKAKLQTFFCLEHHGMFLSWMQYKVMAFEKSYMGKQEVNKCLEPTTTKIMAPKVNN